MRCGRPRFAVDRKRQPRWLDGGPGRVPSQAGARREGLGPSHPRTRGGPGPREERHGEKSLIGAEANRCVKALTSEQAVKPVAPGRSAYFASGQHKYLGNARLVARQRLRDRGDQQADAGRRPAFTQRFDNRRGADVISDFGRLDSLSN